MPNRYLPAATRAALAAQTECQACGGPGPFDYDHHVPVGLGGGNEIDNMRTLCRPCHLAKTRQDIRMIRKADRQRRKHFGTWREPKRKMRSRPFDKRYRKCMGGTVVERRA